MPEMSEGRWQDDRRRRHRRLRRWPGTLRIMAAVAAALAAAPPTASAAFLPIHNPAGGRSRGRTMRCVGGPTGVIPIPIVAFFRGDGLVGCPLTRSSSSAGGTGMWMSSGDEASEADEAATTSMPSSTTTGGGGHGGYYRPFASYAWDRLVSSGLVVSTVDDNNSETMLVPPELGRNSVPAKGPGYPDGSQTSIEIRALRGNKGGGEGDGSRAATGVIRLARYALLETLSPPTTREHPSEEDADVDDADDGAAGSGGGVALPGIHVLNLVIFPDVTRHDLPVFGADLVSLPGDRHLIAIDFQPIRPPPVKIREEKAEEDGDVGAADDQEAAAVTTVKCAFLKEEVEKYVTEPTAVAVGMGDGLHLSPVHRDRLEELHSKYLPDMPWGGDIPPDAERFFSPFALWTRFGGGAAGAAGDGDDGTPDANKRKIETTVFDAFKDYLDLYVDVLLDAAAKDDDVIEDPGGLIEGEMAYLDYRRANDPARPMLTRLYGEDFAEGLISRVLFPSDGSSREEKE